MSTQKRAFSVSWASWNWQKCPEIYYKFGPEISLLAPESPVIVYVTAFLSWVCWTWHKHFWLSNLPLFWWY